MTFKQKLSRLLAIGSIAQMTDAEYAIELEPFIGALTQDFTAYKFIASHDDYDTIYQKVKDIQAFVNYVHKYHFNL